MGTLNLSDFTKTLATAGREIPAEAMRKWIRGLAFLAFTRIIKRTPVDKGRARGNWQITVGNLPSAVLDEIRSEAAAMKAAQDVIKGIPPFDIVFIGNNLPYIEVLEEGGFKPPNPGPTKDKRRWRGARKVKGEWTGTPVVLVSGGFSVQAPNGMVRITFEELTAIAEQVDVEVLTGGGE